MHAFTLLLSADHHLTYAYLQASKSMRYGMICRTICGSVSDNCSGCVMLHHCIVCLQNYIFQREYARLSAEAKLDLLETGICPIAANLQDCNDMKMNYAIDWNLLKPALTQAVDIAFINTWRNRIVEA